MFVDRTQAELLELTSGFKIKLVQSLSAAVTGTAKLAKAYKNIPNTYDAPLWNEYTVSLENNS